MAAALPILASTELDLVVSSRQAQNRRYGTNCSSVDESLCGGFESGRISCISGDRGTGKTTIAIHVLITYLLSNDNLEVAILDTTGTFDVLRLHSAILSRLELRTDNSNAGEGAEIVLKRVKIMRVFDFIGIVESVSEILTTLEKDMISRAPTRDTPVGAPRAMEVPDSEDEISDTDSIPFREPEQRPEPLRVGMLIIDNITSAMNPLLKSNHIQAHSLLVTFMRSLMNLTRNHNLTTVILNSVVTDRNNSSSNLNNMSVPTSNPWHNESDKGLKDWDYPSIFMDNTVHPALGKTFTYFLDFHVLLSMLPKTKWDVEMMYSAQVSFDRRDHTLKPKTVNVIEIVSDRYDGRVGRWVAFAIEGGVQLSTKM